ncbi:helix-turn-helix domain-containing protein [Pedobacter sp. UBA5917]|jgi:hypothetical protein|uniref:AlbA family DNA-binding domain-containing protein n=1 Tax=Pedobacter sp. UBA5917 TaxID=1947061 RepID=UPI0025EBB8CA|nr:ATP-binding protein [Pedobacter sp. UBA5917]
MNETIINLIENESENTKLDFKLEQYPVEKGNLKKGEFLKDMSAFANLTSADDKFIIIGVIEKNGIAADFKPIDQLNDQASYQQFLNEYIEPEINFEYKEIEHQGNRLAYFRLFNNPSRPYLFKKDYNDAQQKGNQYRAGTGFVRSGTSTRGLKREDFEKIYAERLSTKDRSSEIDFDITVGGFQFSELRSTMYRHVKVDLKNLSNTSIDLDIEAKVYNNKGVVARCTQDIERKIFDDNRDRSGLMYTPYVDKVFPPQVFMYMNVDFTDHRDYSTYEITSKKGTHTAVRVKQKGKEVNIFNDQIALVFSRPAEVKIELIVRSNDFPNGPKTFCYILSEEDTMDLLDPRDL